MGRAKLQQAFQHSENNCLFVIDLLLKKIRLMFLRLVGNWVRRKNKEANAELQQAPDKSKKYFSLCPVHKKTNINAHQRPGAPQGNDSHWAIYAWLKKNEF